MAKLAHGLADDLLSTLCLASTIPLLVAPAMNREMWQAPSTQRNLAQLQDDGVQILGPGHGDQACGETGDGRMLEPHQLVQAVIAHFTPKPLQGLSVLITAGPTNEPIDPVRMITNRSSGKTGYAIAQAAAQAGAAVTLVSGPTQLPCPVGVTRLSVQTAVQMHEAVMQHAKACNIFIGVAAVADWRVLNPATEKIKKTQDPNPKPPNLTFALNPDILKDVASLPQPPWCVGFAAETTIHADQAQEKRRQKGVPLLIANLAQEVMDVDHTTVELYDEHGVKRLATGSKTHVAQQIVAEIVQRYQAHQT
jgi:phosphopantothenoylcysteine decarboxylase/phosphopantothenate--cysteine ligase